MGNILEFILSFLFSPGLPEKKDFKASKIFLLIILFFIIINMIHFIFFKKEKNNNENKTDNHPGYIYIIQPSGEEFNKSTNK